MWIKRDITISDFLPFNAFHSFTATLSTSVQSCIYIIGGVLVRMKKKKLKDEINHDFITIKGLGLLYKKKMGRAKSLKNVIAYGQSTITNY